MSALELGVLHGSAFGVDVTQDTEVSGLRLPTATCCLKIDRNGEVLFEGDYVEHGDYDFRAKTGDFEIRGGCLGLHHVVRMKGTAAWYPGDPDRQTMLLSGTILAGSKFHLYGDEIDDRDNLDDLAWATHALDDVALFTEIP